MYSTFFSVHLRFPSLWPIVRPIRPLLQLHPLYSPSLFLHLISPFHPLPSTLFLPNRLFFTSVFSFPVPHPLPLSPCTTFPTYFLYYISFYSPDFRFLSLIVTSLPSLSAVYLWMTSLPNFLQLSPFQPFITIFLHYPIFTNECLVLFTFHHSFCSVITLFSLSYLLIHLFLFPIIYHQLFSFFDFFYSYSTLPYLSCFVLLPNLEPTFVPCISVHSFSFTIFPAELLTFFNYFHRSPFLI